VQFSAAAFSVSEGAGAATITVTLSSAAALAVTVQYATGYGTAAAGSDYVASNGIVTFAAGETSKTFNVPIVDDTAVEGDETINLTLSAPSNATLGTPSGALLTIVDDDPPVLACRNVQFMPTVSSDGAGLMTMTIDVQNTDLTSPITAFDMRIRVHQNTDENSPVSGASDPAIVSNSPDVSEPSFINYNFSSTTPWNTSVISASYRSTTPPQTDDDTFRVQFTAGGVICTMSRAFSPTQPGSGPTQPVTLAIMQPANDGDVIGDTGNAARFTAKASSGAGIIWVHFVLTHVGSNQVVWDWTEYYSPYCAFGDAMGMCRHPKIDYPSWWNALPNASYRLDAIAWAADGGSATATRWFQLVH
jgi:hypothetical protein